MVGFPKSGHIYAFDILQSRFEIFAWLFYNCVF